MQSTLLSEDVSTAVTTKGAPSSELVPKSLVNQPDIVKLLFKAALVKLKLNQTSAVSFSIHLSKLVSLDCIQFMVVMAIKVVTKVLFEKREGKV